ncbi:MFS transporter [Sphingobium phenoxybenzoativorans]|uniref:MFS transporter n=1 Tax=Sphingobium phenoxybenzoativorans TaxID=1592790 RepID=UPI000871E0CB|nr:MFS transporter [Sphingobium phenoxybenzoativorans]
MEDGVVGFLAINCATGVTFGTFGPALAMIETEFGVTRAATSSALGLVYLALGLVSPLVGMALQRFSIRSVMIAGAILNILGNLLLAEANNFALVASAYALLIGPGVCLLSVIPVSLMISRWFDKDRGKALGLANMLLFLTIWPPIAAVLILSGGRPLLFLSLAAIFALLIPILSLIVEPSDAGTDIEPNAAGQDFLPIRSLLANGSFWIVSLAIGVMSGASTIFAVHSVSMATSKGIDLPSAASLMSAFGLAAILGAMAFGWLADRIGPFLALAINAAALVLCWLSLTLADGLPMMVGLSAIIGLCLGALVPLHGMALSHLFRAANVGRAMGFGYFIMVPFLFGAAPLAGFLFDRTRSYDTVLLTVSCALAGAALGFGRLAISERGKSTSQTLRRAVPGDGAPS